MIIKKYANFSKKVIQSKEGIKMADSGSVTSKVVKYIRDNIQNGTWTTGDKIPSENQLCQTLSVSRVSVRNALQQFISLGILESIHGKGTFIITDDLSMFTPAPGSKPQSEEMAYTMKYILQFRCLIEPAVCGEVAENPSPALIEYLSRELEVMRTSIGKSREFVESDVRFHMAICQASKNPIIGQVMADIFERRANLGHMLNLATGYYGGIYYHSMILDCFKRHDSKRARLLMQEHLQRGIYDLEVENEEALSDPVGGENSLEQIPSL